MENPNELTWAIAKKLVDDLLFQQTHKHLNDIEIQVFEGAWEGKSYAQMAEELGYTTEYINSDVGYGLWQKLSLAFEEKVTKRSFRGAIERQWMKDPQIFPSHDVTQQTSQENPATPLYLERPPTEQRCVETMMQPGAMIRIKAPQKMGKTWLIDHIFQEAKKHDYLTVSINLMGIETQVISDLERFLKNFCARITRQLRLKNQLEDYWDADLGSNTSCTEYFEEYILANCDRPLVIAIDNVDRLFPYRDVADNFFSLLRAWYEDARIMEDWQKLRVIIAHSTETYPTLNINRSPFNVGLAIELGEFTTSQIESLIATIHFPDREDSKSTISQQLINLFGGHPYLIQSAIQTLISEPKLLLESFINDVTTESGIFAQHLRDLLSFLQDDQSLKEAMLTLLQAKDKVKLEPTLSFKLHSLGLISLSGNEVELRCKLYRDYFRDRL